MNACRNDGGIVHTPYGEYVIVLMNKDFHDIIEYNEPVSYTHLDVYKRQPSMWSMSWALPKPASALP